MADMEKGVRKSAMSPKYLHTNSTSHTWPFSAIAELIDNAYDPDVSAKQMWIDVRYIKNELCLSFTDDGAGMLPDKLHKMLSFGYCEKVEVNGHRPVGHYGNGFKSGSMRLGKDALVLTKREKYMSAGLLSQTYLSAINADTIMVPIVAWHSITNTQISTTDGQASLNAILTYSLFRTEQEILREFQAIEGDHGTRIIIYRLRTDPTGKSEFDYASDPTDILVPDDSGTSKQGATRSYQSAPANAQIPLDRPDQSWVQCDRCLKWRKLPDTVHADSLLEKWFCEMNTDPVYSRCNVPEEPEDPIDNDRPSYDKSTMRRMERDKLQRAIDERNRQKMIEQRKIVEMQRQIQKKDAELQVKNKQIEHEKKKQLLVKARGLLTPDELRFRENMEKQTQLLMQQLEKQREELARQQEKIRQQQMNGKQVARQVDSKPVGLTPVAGTSKSSYIVTKPLLKRTPTPINNTTAAGIPDMKRIKREPGTQDCVIVIDDDEDSLSNCASSSPANRKTVCTSVNSTQTDTVEIKTSIPDDSIQKLSSLEQQQVLMQKSRELGQLRRNVAKLLQVLVPELDLADNDIDIESNEMDELLRQVLDANKTN
ncbi:MORC family CW-type zinc finger protein 3-like [Saccoglossus kowalevskii]